MFRPESLQRRTKQIKSNNKKNEENRKRNRILNFRVSEEYDLIDTFLCTFDLMIKKQNMMTGIQ